MLWLLLRSPLSLSLSLSPSFRSFYLFLSLSPLCFLLNILIPLLLSTITLFSFSVSVFLSFSLSLSLHHLSTTSNLGKGEPGLCGQAAVPAAVSVARQALFPSPHHGLPVVRGALNLISIQFNSIQFFGSFHTEQYNVYCFSNYLCHQLFVQSGCFQLINLSYRFRLYACPVEIGKELAVSHAPPFVSVDVQCSIAILHTYIFICSCYLA